MGAINFDDYVRCPYCNGISFKVFTSDEEGYYCNICGKIV